MESLGCPVLKQACEVGRQSHEPHRDRCRNQSSPRLAVFRGRALVEVSDQHERRASDSVRSCWWGRDRLKAKELSSVTGGRAVIIVSSSNYFYFVCRETLLFSFNLFPKHSICFLFFKPKHKIFKGSRGATYPLLAPQTCPQTLRAGQRHGMVTGLQNCQCL